MSSPYFPEPVLFFCGVIYREDIVPNVQDVVRHLFPIDHKLIFALEGPRLVQYYQKEMGNNDMLKRAWLFSHEKASRDELVNLKEQANGLETSLLEKHGLDGRPVNLDPGYVALEQVVLATNKPYGHRLYYGRGIYGDLVYQFQQKTWHSLPWTYPDYGEVEVRSHFLQARSKLVGLIRGA